MLTYTTAFQKQMKSKLKVTEDTVPDLNQTKQDCGPVICMLAHLLTYNSDFSPPLASNETFTSLWCDIQLFREYIFNQLVTEKPFEEKWKEWKEKNSWRRETMTQKKK